MNDSDESADKSMLARRLSAVFSADVAGYSRLMGADEEATIATLTSHRIVMSETISAHRGRVVDSPGDNMLAEFASAVDAVRCALAAQSALQSNNQPLTDDRKMRFRIGINVGDVLVEGERIYGDGVNIAARIEALADPGGVCISRSVYDQVEGKLNYGFENLGDKTLKNIQRPVRVYRLHSDPEMVAASAPVNPPTAASDDQKPSIAVLPFQNFSGDPEQEYFSDGMTEDLITDLSKISGLLVISRNSVFAYKNTNVRPDEVSKALGVRYVLEGSVRKAGNRVRITAQLLDASSDYHLWAERYDRQLDDIFEVQDEVIQHIVSALAVTLTSGERNRVGGVPTTNLDAYDAFVRGREHYIRRERAANEHARELFERAIALDPDYAQAHAYLGRTYLAEMVNQWSTAPNLLDEIFRHGEKAVALDESQPTALETLAYGHLAQRNHDSAVLAARQAVRFDPNSAEAYICLAEILNFAGISQESLPLIEQAMRLNPNYTPNYLWALGQTQRLLGNYPEAIAAFQRVIVRNPDHLVAHLMLAACYAETDRLDEARKEAAEVRRISPDFSARRSYERSPYSDPDVNLRQYESLQLAGLD